MCLKAKYENEHFRMKRKSGARRLRRFSFLCCENFAPRSGVNAAPRFKDSMPESFRGMLSPFCYRNSLEGVCASMPAAKLSRRSAGHCRCKGVKCGSGDIGLGGT
jgi:hypothetical protein